MNDPHHRQPHHGGDRRGDRQPTVGQGGCTADRNHPSQPDAHRVRSEGPCAEVAQTSADVSHPVVEEQVHGAVTHGAGQVFGEQGVYDAGSGPCLTGSFMDYFMPRAGMIRSMNVGDEPLPTQLNGLGATSVGEADLGGSLPVLTNAVMDAPGPPGIHPPDMPLTPNMPWRAMHAPEPRT